MPPQAVEGPALEFDLFRTAVLPFSYYVAEDSALLLHVPKVASTSLHWMAAKYEGVDPMLLCAETAHPEIGWDQAVWSRLNVIAGLYMNLPAHRQVTALGCQTKKIAFVRHPVDRVWSSWVSKVLLGEPAYAHHRDATLGPFEKMPITVDSKAQDLAAAFERFLDYMGSERSLLGDAHFMPQSVLLGGKPAETIIVPVSRLSTVLKEEVPSLAQVMAVGERNRTNQFVHGPLLTDSAFSQVLRLFQGDFDAYDDLWTAELDAVWDPRVYDGSQVVSAEFMIAMQAARRLTNMVNLKSQMVTEVGRLQAEVKAAVAFADRLMAELVSQQRISLALLQETRSRKRDSVQVDVGSHDPSLVEDRVSEALSDELT